MDALGSAIRVDTRGREVMRILPRVNDDVNEEWISDKTRHVVDGLRTQRLDQPYVREDGRLRPATWSEAFAAIAAKVKRAPSRSASARIAGDLAAVEEMFALKDLMTRLGVDQYRCRQDGAAFDPAWGRASYLFNATIAGIERADALLIVGSNPRREAAVLNARIRKRWRAGKFPIGLIGEKADLTYPYDYLGAGPETLADCRPAAQLRRRSCARPSGRSSSSARGALGAARWRGASRRSRPRPRSSSAPSRTAGTASACCTRAASRVGALDLGFVPGEGGLSAPQMAAAGALDVVFLLGADEIDVAPGAFVVYIGTHGDRGAHRADVILPGAAYPEKSGALRQHRGPRADGQPRRASRPAMRARTGRSCARCPTCSAASCPTIRSRSCGRRCSRRIRISRASAQIAPAMPADIAQAGGAAAALPTRRRSARASSDFYLTNPIARASAVMAECSALAEGARRHDGGGVRA